MIFKVSLCIVVVIVTIVAIRLNQIRGSSSGSVNAYSFTFKALNSSQDIRLSDYKGKVILVVNTASKCGFTPQYASLESLATQYKERGLVVIGVPSNDFAGQEPGSESDIAQFCSLQFKVNFPMTAKQHVIGKNAHPFYRWATAALGVGSAPKWNFHKIMIDRNGVPVNYFLSTTDPLSPKLTTAIETQLSR